MRRLVWLVGIAALAWSGWWLFASYSLQSRLAQWFEERRAEGWQAEYTEIVLKGYPLALELALIGPVLADPDTGVAFSTEVMGISAPAWWPGHTTVTFPGEEIAIASPLQRLVVSAADAQAAMRLRPGAALELEEMALTAGLWSLTAPQGSIMSAAGLALGMRQATDRAEEYVFAMNAPGFQPGALPRAALRVPSDWPVAFERLALDARIVFDRPFDRRTIEEARPQPRRIDLTGAEAAWGDMMLRAAAGLDVAPDGQLSGEVSLQARNWREILTIAESAGSLPSALRPQLESILAALARGSGNPNALDLTLSLRDGSVYLGFIPLGAAPRVVFR